MIRDTRAQAASDPLFPGIIVAGLVGALAVHDVTSISGYPSYIGMLLGFFLGIGVLYLFLDVVFYALSAAFGSEYDGILLNWEVKCE